MKRILAGMFIAVAILIILTVAGFFAYRHFVVNRIMDGEHGFENPDFAALPEATKNTPVSDVHKENAQHGGNGTEIPETTLKTPEGEQSLLQLRDRISGTPTMFGMAYLGYVGDLFENEFEKDFPIWLKENNETLLNQYPFIAEIDEEHILGGAGHLYCLVPTDENSTVSVNRIIWNERTRKNEVTEILYKSDTGDPILLFANLDSIACEDDTQVIIVDNNGNTCEWYPSLDAEGYLVPCRTEEGTDLSWDFSEYGYDLPEGIGERISEGWLGPTALGLAGTDDWGMVWYTESMVWESDDYAQFMLTFYPGDDSGGAVDLDWLYYGEEEFEEQWSGWWTVETAVDEPSRVTISLSRVGGRNYGISDGPMYISETYSVLINPSGEELIITEGENGICLPFMSQDTLLSTLLRFCG